MTDAPTHDEAAPLLTVALLILATIAFTFADRALAKAERSDRNADAARLYAAGERSARQGEEARAVEEFRSAIAEERENKNYQLALGKALAAAGETEDSETVLGDVLEKDPAWAEANLVLARVLVKEGRSQEATRYYHRAIYGQWSSDPRSGQIKTRFELADLLNREGSQEALLSELLPIEQDVSGGDEPDSLGSENASTGNETSGVGDIGMRARLASLFIAAGSPSRAATMFRDLLRTDPRNAGFYAGDGEAEFALGNYQRAETQFRSAVRLAPSDIHSQQRAQLCAEILRMNPTGKGLSANEQYQRSRGLVEYVRNDVGSCLGSNVPPDAQALMQSADNAKRANTTVEDDLNLARRLWQLRKSQCRQPISSEEQPVALVLAMPGNR